MTSETLFEKVSAAAAVSIVLDAERGALRILSISGPEAPAARVVL